MVNAIKNLQAVPSNGPLIIPSVEGAACTQVRTGISIDGKTTCGMGETVTVLNGQVSLQAEVRVAPWVKINQVNFIVGGESVARVQGDNSTLGFVSHTLEVDEDTWVVVEVSGTESMFPMLTPRELAPIDVTNALGGIAGSFGLELAPFGNLAPDPVGISFPYGFTNPIFIDADGDGEYTPRGTRTQGLTSEPFRPMAGRIDGILKPKKEPVPTLVRMFELFAHSGGH